MFFRSYFNGFQVMISGTGLGVILILALLSIYFHRFKTRFPKIPLDRWSEIKRLTTACTVVILDSMATATSLYYINKICLNNLVAVDALIIGALAGVGFWFLLEFLFNPLSLFLHALPGGPRLFIGGFIIVEVMGLGHGIVNVSSTFFYLFCFYALSMPLFYFLNAFGIIIEDKFFPDSLGSRDNEPTKIQFFQGQITSVLSGILPLVMLHLYRMPN